MFNFSRLKTSFVLFVLLIFVGLTAANAQTVIKSTDFSAQSTVASVAAGAVLVDGWIDQFGGQYQNVNGSGLSTAANAVTSQQHELIAPTAAQLNGGMEIDWVGPGIMTNGSLTLRLNSSNGTCYLVGFDSNISVFTDVVNPRDQTINEHTLSNGQKITSLTTDSFAFKVMIIGNVLTETLIDTTTSTMMDTWTVVDSGNLGPQVAGLNGFTFYTASKGRTLKSLQVLSAAPAATSYTVTASPSTGTPGSPVTLSFAANGVSTTTVMPTVSGVVGSALTPITLNSTMPVTETWTPSVAGTATFSSTNNGSLTDPSSQTYGVSYTPITFSVTSPAVYFSPGNWRGDTGRGGTINRTTCHVGAYCTFVWTTTSTSPATILLAYNPTGASHISYTLDGTMTDYVSLPIANTGISIPVANAGTHQLTVYYRDYNGGLGGWSNTNVLTIAGLAVDSGSTAGTSAWNGKWVEFVGDSIPSGSGVGPNAPNNIGTYEWLIGQTLLASGYDYDNDSAGSTGYIPTGGDVPGIYRIQGGTFYPASRWNKIDGTTSLLDSNSHISAYGSTGQEPAAIVNEMGANDIEVPVTILDLTASITGWTTAVRAAAPNAWIDICIPFGAYNSTVFPTGLSYIAAMKAAVSAYQSANPADLKVMLIDEGAGVSNLLASVFSYGGDHFNNSGHALVAGPLSKTLFSQLNGSITTIIPTVTNPNATTAVIRWNADPLNTAVSSDSHGYYRVWRSANGAASALAALVGNTSTLTFTDPSLQPGSNYDYHIESIR